MNKEEILAMEAGRELDVFTFTSVIKEKYEPFINKQGDAEYPIVPKYSTDISAAWEVVESVKAKGYRIHLNIASKSSGGVINGIAEEGDWHCNVLDGSNNGNHVYAKTAPEAICKAALLTLVEL